MGTVLGGLIGFFSSLYADVRRRKFELKKEAYYAFLKLENAQLPLAPSQWMQEATFAKNCIEIWGNKKVKDIVENILRDENCARYTGIFSKHIKDEFMPAVKQDLSIPWWYFWK